MEIDNQINNSNNDINIIPSTVSQNNINNAGIVKF